MIRPEVEGAPFLTIAEDQLEYSTLTAARVQHELGPGLLLAFKPNADERARILRGENVYISLLTFGHPMQPIIVLVGKREAALAFGLAPSP